MKTLFATLALTFAPLLAQANQLTGHKIEHTSESPSMMALAETGDGMAMLVAIPHAMQKIKMRPEAAAILDRWSEMGVREAIFLKGKYQVEGLGYPRDEEAGLRMVEIAAEMELADAMVYLAEVYLERGDVETAGFFLEQGVMAGNYDAAAYLAILYSSICREHVERLAHDMVPDHVHRGMTHRSRGILVMESEIARQIQRCLPENDELAFRLAESSAERSKFGRAVKGLMLLDGRGIVKNEAQGENNLNVASAHGLFVISQLLPPEKGDKYLLRAAKAGDSEAVLIMGERAIAKGEKDKACEWFRLYARVFHEVPQIAVDACTAPKDHAIFDPLLAKMNHEHAESPAPTPNQNIHKPGIMGTVLYFTVALPCAGLMLWGIIDRYLGGVIKYPYRRPPDKIQRKVV